MKKLVLVLLSAILILSIFACGDKDITSYDGYNGVPDFGKFVVDAEFNEEGSTALTEAFNGAVKESYVYNIAQEQDEKVYEYIKLLEKNGFVCENGEIEAGDEIDNLKYSNQDSGIKILISDSEHEEKTDIRVVMILVLTDSSKDIGEKTFDEVKTETDDIANRWEEKEAVKRVVIECDSEKEYTVKVTLTKDIMYYLVQNKEDEETIETWNNIADNFKDTANNITSKFNQYGYSPKVVLYVVNPVNEDRVILAISDGQVVVDFINE